MVAIINSASLGEANGEYYKSENLHLTLHFLGDISNDYCDCIIKAASRVKSPILHIALNKLDTFSRAKILYLGMTNVPGQLVQLHRNLGIALQHCGFKPETRMYTPHVTLMRKVSKYKINRMPPQIIWTVDKFALIESTQLANGVSYCPLKFFKLVN